MSNGLNIKKTQLARKRLITLAAYTPSSADAACALCPTSTNNKPPPLSRGFTSVSPDSESKSPKTPHSTDTSPDFSLTALRGRGGDSTEYRPHLLPCQPMPREALVDSRQEILRTAARLFQQRGYDATSMNDVAGALKLSKGGLYHHFQSKDEILFEIMNHAMEITEERVLGPVRGIADPEERLRALIRRHIEVVLSPQDREITVMLHENHPLQPALRKRINVRKKDYVHFVEGLVAEVQRARHAKGSITPRAAAFALLGMINWIYQWYKPEGALQANSLIPQFTDLFLGGILA